MKMPAETQAIILDSEVEALLAEARLPVWDLAHSRGLQLLGVRDGGHVVGIVGVEVHGNLGLLRSLAVTPAPFFAKRGYESVAWSEAPPEIAVTAQFKELCPASAVFMRKALAARHARRAPQP